MKIVKSVFKTVSMITLFSILTRFLGFVFRVYLSRKLGAEGIGLFQLASSILGIFLTLISSGIPLTTAKFVSKYEANNLYNKRNKVVTTSLVISFIIAVISCALILILKGFWAFILTDKRIVDILFVLVPSIVFSAIYSAFRGGLWGQHDYFNCGLTELIEQIIRFISTFILLFSVTDIFIATKLSAYAFNITCFISAIVAMIIYLKRSKLDFRKGEYKNLIKSALPVTGVKVASSLVQPITSLIIPAMLVVSGQTNVEAISSYGVIMGMVFPMLFVPLTVIGSISMVLIPSISSMLAKNEIKNIKNNITKSLEVSTFISMLFVPLYLSVGNLIGLVLFNNAMAGTMLQLSSICILPISLCNLTSSVLDALNLEFKSFKNYLIGSLILILGLLCLTPFIGVKSIIISYFLSMLTITLLNLKTINKSNIHLSYSLAKTSFKYIFIILPCSLLGNTLSSIFLKAFTPFFSGLIGGGVAIVSCILLIQTFNLFNIMELKTFLKRKPKNT